MTDRILPQAEWGKLAQMEIGRALPYMNPEDVTICVVEDGDQIIGAWAVLRVVQLEGVWIAPEHRKKGRVAAKLLNRTMEVARSLAPHWAYTGAETPEVADLLTKHLGAVKYPVDTYLIPLSELTCP